MAKDLSARIAARRSQSARRGRHKAAFIVLRDQVEKALAKNWPIYAIWETLYAEGKVTAGYESFRRYVRRLILNQPSKRGWEHDLAKKEPERNRSKPSPEGVRQQHVKATGIREFKFDPVPKKEELL